MSVNSPRPSWLRKEVKLSSAVLKTKKKVASLGLTTVCESARCPNLSECFSSGNAAFMILGRSCTRNCSFCAVEHGSPVNPDSDEGLKIAAFMSEQNIHFAVITSVTRDDLPDRGAAHFVRVVEDIKKKLPGAGIELLVPDFMGCFKSVGQVVSLPIEVFAHNLETVERLYSEVRCGADYRYSLKVLAEAAETRGKGTLLKSGIMVGLGENLQELDQLFADLVHAGVEILTIGQYLRPSRNNLAVKCYYSPGEFRQLEKRALNHGLKQVIATPYVRSSYLAEQNYQLYLARN